MSEGIQNNRQLTVDVVYTQRGRYYKSINSPDAEITKFALSDDGVDYNLYDDNLADDEKAKKITNTPQFSAWTDGSALMRNKLMTLARNTEELGNLEVSPSQLVFEIDPNQNYGTWSQTITLNAGFKTPNGYTVSLRDAKYVYLDKRGGVDIDLPFEDDRDGARFTDPRGRQINRPRIIDSGRIIDTIKVEGSDTVPSTSTFTVTYDESYRTFTQSTGDYKTVLTIESLDRGVTKDVEIILRQI